LAAAKHAMVLRRDGETTCDATKYTFMTAIHQSIGNVIQPVTIALVGSLNAAGMAAAINNLR